MKKMTEVGGKRSRHAIIAVPSQSNLLYPFPWTFIISYFKRSDYQLSPQMKLVEFHKLKN